MQYSLNGARVVVADLQPNSRDPTEKEPTHQAIEAAGGKAVFVKTDVSDAESVNGLVERAVQWGGRVDMYSTFYLPFSSLLCGCRLEHTVEVK